MGLSNEQKIGLFFFGGVVLFVAFIELTVGTGLFSRRYRLWAEFRDVQGLASGAQVRLAGVKVGTVDGIELLPDKVRVALQFKRGIDVREDAVARLDFQALSGTRFVAIDLGNPAAKPLPPDSTIRTEEPAGLSQMVDELKQVATSIHTLTDSLNENQDRLLNNINVLVEENRQTLTRTFDNLKGITDKLAKGEGTLGRLLVDSRLYDEAIFTLESLRESFGDIRKVTGQLASNRGTIGRLLNDDGLYDDLRETVASLNTTAQNFAEISDQVRRGEGTLGRLIADDRLYNDAQGAVQGLTRATQGIEDQAPISVLGTLIGTLF